MALHIAFALALFETLALAGVLLVWARQVDGARLLVAFLVGIVVWITGNELPNWLGPPAMRLAMSLLATAPLSAAAFLHFCLVICRLPRPRWALGLAYGAGAAAMLLSVIVSPGHFQPFAGITWVPMPNWAGWITSLTWGAVAGSGMLVLLFSLARPQPPAQFRQTAAVALSCGWGLVCMSGYGIAAFELPFYPWPLLGLPLYPLILVYGMLRYRVFVANAWARRALAWALLLALGLAVVPLTLLLPVESRWLSGAAVAATCLALNGPVRRFAERLVYPGASVSAADLADWRQALDSAESPDALAQTAAALLSQRVGTEIAVSIGDATHGSSGAAPLAAEPARPLLLCHAGHGGNGAWATTLHGWDAAPPGPRHLAEFFGVVLAEAAAQVQRAQQAGQRERERQLQARLAELGALAATVAHDLRNPLNIIAMAVATAPAETRQEVAGQVARISRLAEDLLDYAKPWQLKRQPFDLAARLRELLRRWPEVELAPALREPWWVDADPQRVDQALGNLLTNARTAAHTTAHTAAHSTASAAGPQRVLIDIELVPSTPADTVLLHVCDQGPGVPPDLRERLFEPFASRSPGGTGLGLAIVARIMAAHGGAVNLSDRPPWTTCFTLRFTAAAAPP
ncbi:sensor histidine kinase [Aquabacterium sp.]|uniref:sensor histidine kinase n=1 Tax=Aquabacterium sp. TaxID=1872578 RepID=UPI002B9874D4|nr:HAMP domain-containing sensor histidine kinase [Aquabacterium sp.]HSW06713.1 HAMP domain-containing sensor histidine kinase [Aquabacterium sp.]